ncbi:hypothetical protein D1007_20596 [Hordeum vulgare]|nr:hypothetical protein D1007_20596 [Hordeum vulgare]
MADTHRARVERRTTRVAQTVHVGSVGARRSPSPVVNAPMGLDVQAQQGSSHPATEQPDSRTATPSVVRASRSASSARTEISHGWRVLAMATELLRYRPAPDRHNWLQCIEELVAAADDLTAFTCLFRPQPYMANIEEQDAPPPPPRRVARLEPR